MSLARNLALAVLALGLVVGAIARSAPAPRAEAAPEEVLLIHNVTCLLLTALVEDAEDPLESPAACLSLNQPVNLFDVSQLLGGVDDVDDRGPAEVAEADAEV